MTDDMMNQSNGEVIEAIQRVLGGDVDAYESIYDFCDRPLRAFVGKRFGWLGKDFIDEVAVLTHEYAFAHLDKYDKGRASFQTWLNQCSLNCATQVQAVWYGRRRVRDKKGRRRPERRFVAFDEEVHARYVPAVPGPEEVFERKKRNRLVEQEYRSLSRQGRLSIAAHDLEGLSHSPTARRLGVSEMTARRVRQAALKELERRLRGTGVRLFERDCASGRVFRGSPYDDEDDWCASATAILPDGPDVPAGAREEEK